jgi:hypothetical protein
MKEQIIQCRVSTCKHNDKMQYCSLNSIQVSCEPIVAHNKCETQCINFEEA